MLTELQKAFIRNYLTEVAYLPGEEPTEADHTEAGRIWDDIAEAKSAAAELRVSVENLEAPDHADAGEIAAISMLKNEATAALTEPLTEENALEAVAAARELIKRAQDAIEAAAKRVSAAEAAWKDASTTTEALIAKSKLNATQQEALRLALEAVDNPADDFSDTDARIDDLKAVKDRLDLILEADLAAAKRLEAAKTLPEKLHKAEIELINAAREKAVAAVAKIVDATSIELAGSALGTLEDTIGKAAEAAEERAELRADLEAAILKLEAPDAATEAERKTITDPASAAVQLLTGDPAASALKDALKAAAQGIEALEAANLRITEARARWKDGVDKVETDLSAARPFPLSKPQTEAVQALIDTAQSGLAKDLSNVPAALTALAAPAKLLTLLTDAVDRLNGDLAKVAALPGDALSAEKDKYAKAASDAVADIAALVDASGIKAAETAIAAMAKIQVAVAAAVDKRKDLLKKVAKEKLEAVCAALGSVDAVDAIVGAVKPDASGLFDDTKIAPKDLAALYTDALAGDANVLAAVFQTGFGSNPEQLNTFAASLDPKDRKRVTAMVAKGGFAEAPQALGELVKLPGGTDKLKDLGATFNDDPGLAALRGGIAQGGLGGAGARSPDVLASVLTDGVASAAELKQHLDGFGPAGMAEMRAMLSAFDGTPPPSEAGKAFAKVAGRVCPPDNGMKTQFFDTLDRSSAMSGASKALQKVAADPNVTLAAKAIGRKSDPVAEAGLSVTLAGVAALQAGEGIPGVDATQRTLLEAAIKASGKATVAMADAGVLGADKAAAKAAAEAALDASDVDAASKANAAATLAGNAADVARDALALASPATADLLDKAAAAAAEAVAKAKAAPEDGVRDAVLAQAKLCFDAVTAATTTLGQAVADDARTKAQTNALAKSEVEGAKVTDAAAKQAAVDLYEDQVANCPTRIARFIKIRDDATARMNAQDLILAPLEIDTNNAKSILDAAKKAKDKNTPVGKKRITDADADWKAAKALSDPVKKQRDKEKQAAANAESKRLAEEAIFAAAPGNLALAQTANTLTVAQDRKTGLVEIQASTDQAEASRNAKLIADDPALQAAFAKAARLQALSVSPEATPADHLATAEAESDAARLIADATAAPALGKATALEMPDLSKSGADLTAAAVSSSDDLIAAALDVKQALALAVARQEKAQAAYVAQERLVLDAQKDVDKFGSVDPYKKALADEKLKLAAKEAERGLAAGNSSSLAAAAKRVDDALTKNIGAQNKVLAVMDPMDVARPAREAERDALQNAAAMIVLALNRSYSAGYPAMNRDQLLSVASTMTKAPLTGMGEDDPLPGTDAKVDMKHFCGRHTREFCSFEGRDLSDYDEAMGSAIIQAQKKGLLDSDLTPGEVASRDSRAQIKTTSMWPGGFGKADVEACLKLTIIEVEKLIVADGSNAATTIRPYIDLPNDQRAHKGTQFQNIAITHNSVNYTVQIGVGVDPSDASKFTIGQFFPTNTPSVPFADMHALKSAMKH
ncbi:hypothetical protein GC209_16865 [bacterium]|nr:hypothetical protein [bacterium]